MRLAIDVCVSLSTELELWRAGNIVPVRAAAGEPDAAWLHRAEAACCHAVITGDKGAAYHANRRGMYSVLVPHGIGGGAMTEHILDGVAEVEARMGDRPLVATILAPLVAVGIALLAACAPAPRPLATPLPAPTPWCFPVSLAWDGGTEAGLACGSTRNVCEVVQRRAVRWGGIAGLLAVGGCEVAR